jgi:cytochrome c oxidase subunit 2
VHQATPGVWQTHLVRKRIRALGGLVLVGGCVLPLAGCGSDLGLPDPATDRADHVFDLWRVFVFAGIAVGCVVLVLVLWTVLRYRARPGRQARRVEGSPILTSIYILTPLAIVIVLSVLTVRTDSDVLDVRDNPDVTVHVSAFDWSWQFEYEGDGVRVIGTPDEPPTLVLPVDRRIRVKLDAVDVIHSFYVPAFLFKRDAIPGRKTEFEFTVKRSGRFRGHCAEFCGLDHARMLFYVEAVPAGEFDVWLANQRSGASPPPATPTPTPPAGGRYR